MHPFEIDGRTYLIHRSAKALPSLDLLSWLENSSFYPKVYWKDRDGQTARAAVGDLFSFPHLPRFSKETPFDIRLYGGIRFSDKYHQDDATWRGFPRTCFWLPQIELSQRDNEMEAIFYSFDDQFNPGEIKISSSFPKKHSLLERLDIPDFRTWGKNIKTALDAISSGSLDKVVLARKTTLQFLQPLSLWSCLNHLKEKVKSATLFAFQLSPSLCFLGATPEKLFEREGNLLSADALAGTQPRGATAEEDLQYEQVLRNSTKDRREFNIVKEFLHKAISPLSQKIQWDRNDRILKASHVQHIHNRLNATLRSGIFDEELIDALHPTPALGGHPRDKASLLLNQLEHFDRGWYGGPIGVISSQGANLYVAIRSALIRENAMHLFAGTGIVQGSIAEKEWDELEQKIRPFTELFF